jgi:hypothetical protein
MEQEQMQEAFNAIHDEALDILKNFEDLPEGVTEGLNRIVALSRYQFDVRTVAESHE